MANTSTNKIRIGENVRIVSPLTDSAGAPVPFLNILTSSVVVTDVLGNEVTPVISVDDITPDPNGLTYEVDTATLKEGDITARLDLTFNSPSFPTSFARDILEQTIFKLFP